MPYSLAIKASVLKDLQPIPKEIRGRIAVSILELMAVGHRRDVYR